MRLSLSALWTPSPVARPEPRPPSGPRFRPVLEGFEDRVVPAAPALAPALAAPAAASPVNILPIQINNILNNNGVLTAVGQVGNTVFNALASLTASQNAS